MRVLRTHPFWVHAVRRHRRARGTPAAPDKPSAYDERHDISLLSSRFRSAAVNARYEASRPQEDSAIFFAMHALIFAAITPATGAALWDGFGGERLSAPLLAQLLLFVTAWLVRLGAVVLYWRDAVPRGVCELATFAQVLVRIGVRTAVTIPRAVASEDVGSEFLARLEVAAATLEVAALARYALALPTCAWALLAQPLAPALASLVGYDAADAQLGARGEAGVAAAALLSLPIYLHIEVARRRAWLQGERLAALRQEVSHFGLNHLYHASSTIDQAIERLDAAPLPAALWLGPALAALAESVTEVTQLLRLIVDDDAPPSEAALSDFNLDDFAALAFRGVAYDVEGDASELRARFASWAARSIAADAIAVARRHARGAVLCTLAVDGARAWLSVRVRAQTGGVALPLGALRGAPVPHAPDDDALTVRSSGPSGSGSMSGRNAPGGYFVSIARAAAGPAAGPLAGAAAMAAAVGGRLLVRQDAACAWLVIELQIPIENVRLQQSWDGDADDDADDAGDDDGGGRGGGRGDGDGDGSIAGLGDGGGGAGEGDDEGSRGAHAAARASAFVASVSAAVGAVVGAAVGSASQPRASQSQHASRAAQLSRWSAGGGGGSHSPAWSYSPPASPHASTSGADARALGRGSEPARSGASGGVKRRRRTFAGAPAAAAAGAAAPGAPPPLRRAATLPLPAEATALARAWARNGRAVVGSGDGRGGGGARLSLEVPDGCGGAAHAAGGGGSGRLCSSRVHPAAEALGGSGAACRSSDPPTERSTGGGSGGGSGALARALGSFRGRAGLAAAATTGCRGGGGGHATASASTLEARSSALRPPTPPPTAAQQGARPLETLLASLVRTAPPPHPEPPPPAPPPPPPALVAAAVSARAAVPPTAGGPLSPSGRLPPLRATPSAAEPPGGGVADADADVAAAAAAAALPLPTERGGVTGADGTAAPAALLPLPPKHAGVDRARFRAPATAAERARRILVVLDNHLDPPAWSGALSGQLIARRLRELGADVTVVLHTGCSPAEVAALLAAGCVDAVTVKDKPGREHVCNLCAQHDLCLFVDDMPMILAAMDAALGRALYAKVRSPAHAGGWAATANTHVRYAMFSREAELDLVYAVCTRALVFEDNVLCYPGAKPGRSPAPGGRAELAEARAAAAAEPPAQHGAVAVRAAGGGDDD